jgi:hypothetical protein
MVHYIRFLSPPQVLAAPKKALNVSVVLAVTTDLGDTYLSDDANLLVRVVESQTHALVAEQTLVWKEYSRAVKGNILCNAKYANRSIRVHVTTSQTQTSLAEKSIPQILDVWSTDFDLGDKVRSEPLVARELPLSNDSRLQVWEETGDSIARHVWDASLGFLIYLESALRLRDAETDSDLVKCLQVARSKPLQVLELGTGCGTVGIAFAQLCKSHVVLTDLDDAMEILHRNVKAAHLTPSSTLQGHVLDWGSDLDDSFNSKYDLILVSDCIYNPDSSVHLVKTLLNLVQRSPNALIVVGFKRRHSGDDVFFQHMDHLHFALLSQQKLDLPHIGSDHDAYEPIIEFYIFKAPSN